MGKSGRKRKPGRRHPGGQLVRTPKIDKGTPETQARRKAYAGRKGGDRHDPAQTIDPLGRAWCAGLISDEQRDAGRRFAALYWRKLPDACGNPVSGLYRNMISGLREELPPGVSQTRTIEDADERDQRQEEALNRMLRDLPRRGTRGRIVFDQLVLDPWFDSGPPWLDRIIASRLGFDHPEADTLALAKEGLDRIA